MAQVKIGKMSVPVEVQFTTTVVTEMTGNANFTTPLPALTALTTAATALQTAYTAALAARVNAKALTSIVMTKKAALDLLLAQEANYVQNTSGGDKAKIESSGFPVRSTAAPIGALPPPANVVITPNDNAGTVNMKWNPVRGADSYVVERAADSPTLTWVTALNTSKAKAIANTMVSGTKYWFRIAAIGAAGQGAWSDAIAKIAP